MDGTTLGQRVHHPRVCNYTFMMEGHGWSLVCISMQLHSQQRMYWFWWLVNSFVRERVRTYVRSLASESKLFMNVVCGEVLVLWVVEICVGWQEIQRVHSIWMLSMWNVYVVWSRWLVDVVNSKISLCELHVLILVLLLFYLGFLLSHSSILVLKGIKSQSLCDICLLWSEKISRLLE